MSTRDMIINALMFIDRAYIMQEYEDENKDMSLLEDDMKTLYEEYDKKSDSELLIELLYTHTDVKFEELESYIKAL